MPNRLAAESSPYLLQHQDNPVDWYPWGEEAFEKARAQDRPILLSVGYSACHWCHVMAHESFENESTAKLMNQWFVNVKVDREERPDVDSVYMTAVQAMTGSGGWPMTVFLTPDLRPFYAGTYFPPADGHGRPGFPRVLEALHDAWNDERPRILSSADGITDHIAALANRHAGSPAAVTATDAAAAAASFAASFDSEFGGFGQAPKFPSPPNLEFLLAHHVRTAGGASDPPALDMALTTLVRMAQGGMYDHLGGGFARYSVDRYWLVPHFEKMLYDNAQLVRVYTHAFQLTGDPFFARVVDETLTYLQREMLDPAGGFYAAQDADSEGIEGKFFVWTPEEFRDVLGADAALAMEWFGVTERGNFQDPHHPEFGRRTVLATWEPPEEFAQKRGLSAEELDRRLASTRGKLFAARDRRIHPGLDDKVLTAWNGLALGAFAEAGRVFGNARWVSVAERCAAFLHDAMWDGQRLKHTWKAGISKVDAMLEDYAYLGLGLVDLFRATGDESHLGWARDLFAEVWEHFRDPSDGLFFETRAGAEHLIVRQKAFFDSATPGGSSAAGLLAFWLGRYFGDHDWVDCAEGVVASQRETMKQAPTGFGTLWQVAELLLAPRQELAIVGDDGQRSRFNATVAGLYIPWIALAPGSPGSQLPLFAGREPGTGGQAYFCQDMVCQLPVGTPADLAAQLEAAIAR
ncbi:MAG: thioredoxin domain-containing protein [Dehalococcoidia bacterium]